MGYEDLLDALSDPAHPEHDHQREWAPPDVDPTFFDTDEAIAAMRSVRPLERW